MNENKYICTGATRTTVVDHAFLRTLLLAIYPADSVDLTLMLLDAGKRFRLQSPKGSVVIQKQLTVKDIKL